MRTKLPICTNLYRSLKHRFERYEISNYARGKATAAIILCTGIITRMQHLERVPAVLTAARVFTAAAKVQNYIQLIQSGGQLYDKEELPVPVQFEEFMFMNLRKKSGVSLTEAKQRFGI